LALDLEDYHPSVLLHCWLGHLTCKIVFRNDLQCVEWDVKPYNTIHRNTGIGTDYCGNPVVLGLYVVLSFHRTGIK